MHPERTTTAFPWRDRPEPAQVPRGIEEFGPRARDMRPEDGWNYGVIGDALLELGEYDEASPASRP